jgi:hypothetical protein
LTDYIEAYFIGDPTDAAAFTERVDRARAVLGANITTYDRPVERLWAYGSGWGATHGYDTIEGDVRAPSADAASPTAQRVASRLSGREVVGATQSPFDNYIDVHLMGDLKDGEAIEKLKQQAARAIVELEVDRLEHQSDVQRLKAFVGEMWDFIQ